MLTYQGTKKISIISNTDTYYPLALRVSVWGLRVRQTYNQFNSISKSGIHQATKGLAERSSQLLGSKAEQRSEGNDSKEIEDKDSGWVPFKGTRNDAQWHEDKQDIDVVTDDGFPRQMDDVHWPVHPHTVILWVVVVLSMLDVLVRFEAREGATVCAK